MIENGKKQLKLKLDNIVALAHQAQELSKKGLSLEEVVLELLGKEDMASKLTGGNFSKRNLISESLPLDLSVY